MVRDGKSLTRNLAVVIKVDISVAFLFVHYVGELQSYGRRVTTDLL